jgi:hypothetical protein
VAGQGIRRVRRVRGTAAAVAAMAALTASQAPGAAATRASVPVRETAEHGPTVSGDTPYRSELPPLTRGHDGKGTGTGAGTAPVTGGAVPATVFAAYRHAEAELARTAPGCGLRWQLLAAIGQVESGQAGGGRVSADGTTLKAILGPRLDGGDFAVVRDTDGGAYDGDAVYDRAVGPMQFIPSTWARWGADGNGDGRADPDNVFDAALAAGRYLCAAGRDLSGAAGLDRAILGYNHSAAYLRTVRAWYAYFLAGHRVVPDGSAAPFARSSQPRKHASPASSAEPAPKPAVTPKPPATPRPGASPSAAPASPTPADSPSGPGGSAPSLAPAPVPSIELPVGEVLPTTGL